jgi:two-component system, chemotaxis family, chemotaxis protein CheY
MALDLSMPVLVVDDFATMVRIMRTLLQRVGFAAIEEVHDGASALDRLRTKHFELVVADWNMSPMTGLELLAHIRRDPMLRPICFILVSAERRSQPIAEALAAGVDGFLIKPFTAAALRATIERAVTRARPRRSRSEVALAPAARR